MAILSAKAARYVLLRRPAWAGGTVAPGSPAAFRMVRFSSTLKRRRRLIVRSAAANARLSRTGVTPVASALSIRSSVRYPLPTTRRSSPEAYRIGSQGEFPMARRCRLSRYATAASVHAALGIPVAMAIDSGNLLLVARSLRST